MPERSPDIAAPGLSPAGPCRFSIRHYRDTLHAYLASGYNIKTCGEAWASDAATGRSLVLRHDVDMTPADMLPMMQAEVGLGVRSSIFVRAAAAGYTPEGTFPVWRRAIDSGFEIGLHYEPDEPDPRGAIAGQKRTLEAALGTTVRGASAHRPATTGYTLSADERRRLGFEYEAYEMNAKLGLKYLSDSRRHWRESCFCRWVGRANRLSVLVHPEWWRPGSLRRQGELLALL